MQYKQNSLILNIIFYVLAFGCGTIPYLCISNMLLASLSFTLTATLIIFIFTCLYKDTSIYDPYWSVEPPVLLIMHIIRYKLFSVHAILLFIVFCVWSIRLTINWYVTYKGLRKEDWRYHDFRIKYSPTKFFFINLTGFQYVPTLVVFLGMIPALLLMQEESFHPLTLIGYLLMLVGILFEQLADQSVHAFLKRNKGIRKTCDKGIWKYSRHPNYLGELTFWFGLMVAYLLVPTQPWYMGIGSLSIDAVFIFASIPLMEAHNNKRRSDYKDYQKKTSVLFLWPPKST